MNFSIFEATPGTNVLLLSDAPRYTIVAVTHDLAKEVGKQREELIGKGLFEVFPENPYDPNRDGEENLKSSFEYVIKNKQRHQLKLQRYDIPAPDGTFSERYWSATNAPVLNEEGEVEYIAHATVNVTEQVLSEKRESSLKDIEKNYHLFMQAPVAVCILSGPQFVVDLANESMLTFLGRASEIIGKPIIDSLIEADKQGLISILEHIRTTGGTYVTSNFPATILIDGVREDRYFDLVFKPYYKNDEATEVTAIFCVAHNVTQQVLALRKLEEVNEDLNFRTAVLEAQNEATTDGVVIVDSKGNMLLYNQRFADLWNFPKEIIESKDDVAALEHAKTMLVDPEGFIKRVTELYTSNPKKSYDEILFKDGRVIERFGALVEGKNKVTYGWAWYFRDITERKEQETRQRIILESLPQMAWTANEKGEANYYNKRWYQFSGKDFDALKGFGWRSLIHEDDIEELAAKRIVTLRTGETFEAEARLRKHNGEYRWHIIRAVAIKNEGVIVLWVGTCTDINNVKELEASLKLQARVLESMDEGVSVADENGLILYTNNAEERIFGYEAGELIGLHVSQQNAYDAAENEEKVNKVMLHLNEHGSWHGEWHNKRKDGSAFYTYSHITAMESGGKTLLVCVQRDITLEREAEIALRRSAAELENLVSERTRELQALNDQLQQFAYAASHDLQEPLRKISFFIDRLKTYLLPEGDERNLQLIGRVQSTTVRMSSLINDLLNYSNTTLGATRLQEVQLNELINEVIDDLEARVIEMKADLRIEKLPVIKGDGFQLRQLFHNLISNSLKYSSPATPPTVSINCEIVKGEDTGKNVPATKLAASYYKISISDNGIGFEQQYADQIFNIFQRLHGKSEFPGTGIGLAIAHKVVENHHGFIWAESSPNEGATFFVLLPVE